MKQVVFHLLGYAEHTLVEWSNMLLLLVRYYYYYYGC